MPVTVPSRSDLNLTPSSTPLGSPWSTVHGTVPLSQRLHGQPMSTFTLGGVASRLPLSSTARAMTVAVGAPCARHVYDHDVVPVAGCQVLPPSVDTSTPATTPPLSVAVPLTVTCEPSAAADPFAGL